MKKRESKSGTEIEEKLSGEGIVIREILIIGIKLVLISW